MIGKENQGNPLDDSFAVSEEGLAESPGRIDDLKKELEELDEISDRLTRKLEDAERSVETMTKELDAKNLKIKELQAKLAELNAELDFLSED